jgi:RNA recognition motif-containing protein
MNKRLFVGNLAWTITKDQLNSIFGEAGKVISANIILDRETGRSRGFGFVEMETEDEAYKALQTLNNKEIEGRKIIVNEALPEKRNSTPQNNGFSGREMTTDEAIADFMLDAKPGEQFGVKIENRHFTIVRDDKGESTDAS